MPLHITGAMRMGWSRTGGKGAGSAWLGWKWLSSACWLSAGGRLVWWLGVCNGDDRGLTVDEGQGVDFVAGLAVLWWSCWLSTTADCHCHGLDCWAGFHWCNWRLCWLREGISIRAGGDIRSRQRSWGKPGGVVGRASGSGHGCAAWHKLGVGRGDCCWVDCCESLASTAMGWVGWLGWRHWDGGGGC